MVSHFRMGACAEILFRRSKRDLRQRLSLPYYELQLGCELGQSKHRGTANLERTRHGEMFRAGSRTGRTGIFRNA